jgi:hypothetical protein
MRPKPKTKDDAMDDKIKGEIHNAMRAARAMDDKAKLAKALKLPVDCALAAEALVGVLDAMCEAEKGGDPTLVAYLDQRRAGMARELETAQAKVVHAFLEQSLSKGEGFESLASKCARLVYGQPGAKKPGFLTDI